MKEKKHNDQRNNDPVFTDATFTYNNLLAIPDELKRHLTEQNLDWRFLNAREFRASGNYHRSHWKPYVAKSDSPAVNMTTAEGMIQRGDLILGVRPKTVSAKHREYLSEKNRRYSNFSKTAAKEMRDDLRRKGVSGVKIDEGYDEDSRYSGGDRDED